MLEDIEARRDSAGILQKHLCERAGVDQSTYSQIKRGRRAPLHATVLKLSAALDALIAEREPA